MAMLRLVKDGSGPRDEAFALKDVTVLGRASPSQIILPDPSVSREHACIVSTDEGCFIEDLKSTNGTFVNGTRLSAPVSVERPTVTSIR